jgi:hypothetical protein
MNHSPFQEANSHLASQEIPIIFEEPEGTYIVFTGAYPKSDASNPHLLTLFP